MKNIMKINFSVNEGFEETSFGYFTYDQINPRYFDGNTIVIERDNSEVYECMKQHNFAKVIADKEWFSKHNIECEKEDLWIMKTKNETGDQNFKGYTIALLCEELFDQYRKFRESVQLHMYGEVFKKQSKDSINDGVIDTYLIIKDGEIIGDFEVYNKTIFENVYIDEAHRNKGVMRNYLNYISNRKEMYLICGEDVVKFYEKSGFVIDKCFTTYSKVILEDKTILLNITK